MEFFDHISGLHDDLTVRWHKADDSQTGDDLEALIREQHRKNFDLWHKEDRARSPNASPEQIVEVKRAIDSINQLRNDLIEAIDRKLLEELQRRAIPLRGELHSETPAMIIDRLSILALKIFHTREQVARPEASPEHIRKNEERLEILLQQRADLAQCLKALWDHVEEGRRYFKLYRQLKMYNDPELNPEIYKVRR